MINDFGTIGIVGGMGPEATANLYAEVIKATPAKKDQEHVPVFIAGVPQVPDRTDAILFGGESPVPAILNSARKLEEIGADFLIMPCNTSHFFINEIRPFVNLPFLSMIEETVFFVKNNYPDMKMIGLLATTGTVETGIYTNAFRKEGIEIVTLDQFNQEGLVMEAIYGSRGIKSGRKNVPRIFLLKAVSKLLKRGAEAIILGCTEIPLALEQKHVNCILINPTKILAEKAVQLSTSIRTDKLFLLAEEEEE
ncbi:amino acid racemase [Candidatus Woesearchaeota archaeon]|nr:amino acid racemase [Candidatus Woesearchaeota archaeon]